MTLNCTAFKDTRERPRKEKNMFDQKINLQLFGEEDFTDISGAEVSESAEDTAESMESVAETTAEDNADDDGDTPSAVREGVRRHQDFELEKKDLSPTHFRMHRQI